MIESVDRSFVETSEKTFYIKLMRTQLVKEGLILLFYYDISPYGHKKLPLLISRYELLKPQEENVLFDSSHRALFDNET